MQLCRRKGDEGEGGAEGSGGRGWESMVGCSASVQTKRALLSGLAAVGPRLGGPSKIHSAPHQAALQN